MTGIDFTPSTVPGPRSARALRSRDSDHAARRLPHSSPATLDLTNQSLTGDGDRFLFTVPILGSLDPRGEDTLFHAFRDEIDAVQAAFDVPRLDRVTLRVRGNEIQVIIHGHESAVHDWTGTGGRFAIALERALTIAQQPDDPGRIRS